MAATAATATDTVLDTVVPAVATAATALELATVLAVSVDTVLALAKVKAFSLDTALTLATVKANSATTLALAKSPPVSAGMEVSATRLLTALVSLAMDPAPSVSVVPASAALVSVVLVFRPVRPSVPTVLPLASVSVLPTAQNGEYRVTELPLSIISSLTLRLVEVNCR